MTDTVTGDFVTRVRFARKKSLLLLTLLCERNGNVSWITVGSTGEKNLRTVDHHPLHGSMIKPSLDPEAECRLRIYIWLGGAGCLEDQMAVLLSDFGDFQSRPTARHIHGTV
jgi:hypothetical protein